MLLYTIQAEECMSSKRRIVFGSCLLGLLGMNLLIAGCVIEPAHGGYHDTYRDTYREGYYDREHHRYYHDHEWHQCGDRDEHCR